MSRITPALALTLVLGTASACGGDDMTDHEGMSMSASPSDSASPSPSASSSPDKSESAAESSAPVLPAGAISVSVTGDKISPAPKTYDVKVGDEVTISVTSDVAEEVHVHGYDKTVDLEPGVPGEVTFKADIPGVFEAELEGSGKLLFELRVE